MTVVAIVGVLAAIGVILVVKHFRASKAVEASSIIQSIRGAQEARRAESGAYLNVSQQGVWYPATPSGDRKTSWVSVAPTPGTDAARWRELAVPQTDGTRFGFKTWAGNPGPVPGAVVGFDLGLTTAPVFANAADAWYVIEAGGDLDADAKLWRIWASSFDGEVRMEHEGE